MTRRERIVEKVHRIAEAREKQALIGLGRVEAAHREVRAAAEALEHDDAAAEAQLTGAGQLGAVERELLWTHRAWSSRERTSTAEQLALSEADVSAARARLDRLKRETRIRERIKDRVQGDALKARDDRAQRELDELANQRAHDPSPDE